MLQYVFLSDMQLLKKIIDDHNSEDPITNTNCVIKYYVDQIDDTFVSSFQDNSLINDGIN